jgi:hypothetical protein
MPPTSKIRFEVEWCKEIPVDEYGDEIRDEAKYVSEYFESFLAALNRAKILLTYRKDAYGVVVVSRQEVKPNDDIAIECGESRLVWRSISQLHVDDHTETYLESDLEPIR